MIVQPTLFDTRPPEQQPDPLPAPEKAEKPLTERQQFTLELVQHAGREGITADEAGAAWCARRGKHADDVRCEWCGRNGRDVLRTLRRKGHVKSRRDGSWHALEGVVEPDPVVEEPKRLFVRDDGTVGDIPF